jgi:hypothetical protein
MVIVIDECFRNIIKIMVDCLYFMMFIALLESNCLTNFIFMKVNNTNNYYIIIFIYIYL